MNFLKVKGSHEDFFKLCQKLEEFQFDLMPVLKEKGYSLTEDVDDIEGFVLYIDEKPIASIGIKKITNETCEIVRVFICEEYRGKGYAKLLFDKIENFAKTLDFKNAEMVAWSKATSAIKAYKKLGYICSEEKESEWFVGLNYVEFLKQLSD